MSNKLTLDEFTSLLQETIPPSDKVILIYSGIWTFGHRFKLRHDDVPDAILDCIEDACGPDKTVMLPAYTYIYNKTRKYDIRTTKPETGILPELFLKRDGVFRTRSAISSFAVKGPLASVMIPIIGASIWGEGSLLEWLETNNARIMTLGLPWDRSCGYLHRIEEVGQVPYRYYKDFPGEYCDETGIWKKWSESMYVRPFDLLPTYHWSFVNNLMEQRGQILNGSKPGIHIESCLAKDMMTAGLDLISQAPYALVANVNEVREWVESGRKQREILELKKSLGGNAR